MNKKTYTKIVKVSGWYDVIVIVPFAFPILAQISMEHLSSLHSLFQLSGIFPALDPIHYLFVNLMGSCVLIWSIVRVRHAQPLFGLYDAHGRTLFSLWMIYYLFIEGASGILFFLLIPEVLWGIVQYYGYWKYKRDEK